MNDAASMSRSERLGDLETDGQQFRNREWCSPQLSKRVPFDQLHRNSEPGFRMDHLVNGDDVGMVQRGRGFRLASNVLRFQSGNAFGAQKLEGNRSIQLRVARPPD